MQAEFCLKQKAELKAIAAAKAAGQPIPERQYTDDKMPKVDRSLMPNELRGKTFAQLAAMQAQAKKAPPAPSSPVSSSGGRPASTGGNGHTSSSPDSPPAQHSAAAITQAAAASPAEPQPTKTVRAKLFKSEQSSPDSAYTSTAAANMPDGQHPDVPDSNGHNTAPEELPQQQQQQQESQQQQQQSGMPQLVKPFGPVTLRESIKMDLIKEAPSGAGLPENVRRYFQKLITSSVDLSMEKHILRQSMEGQDAKVVEYKQQLEELQGQLEYQSEQMMDLQNQVRSILMEYLSL